MLPLRKSALLVLLGTALVTCPGCWDRREIESLGFVMAVGIDKPEEDGRIQLTVHVARPFALVGSDKGPSPEKPFWMTSSTGYTTFDAMRNLDYQSPRRLFWAHNNFIVIGEEFARNGIRDALDAFYRNPEGRGSSRIIIVKGASARDFLQCEFELERMPAEGYMGVMLAAEEGLSTIVDVQLHEFLQMLENEGSEPFASCARIVARRQADGIADDMPKDELRVSATLAGAAVFKNDRLVGWLDETETRGLNWVRDKVKSGIVLIRQPVDESRFAGLEILRSRSEVNAEIGEGKAVASVRIDVEANLGDVQGFIDLTKSDTVWTMMEERMAGVIGSEVMAAVARARDLDVDVFGFGGTIGRKDPKTWAEVKDQWGRLFRDINVIVEVRARLRRPGLVLRSVRIK